jgi:type I restriction enzyme M protein
VHTRRLQSRALNLVLVNDSATTVSQTQVAGLAGVTRAAVTQWRKRNADFPLPVDGDSDRLNLNDVIGWLDGRPIPASSRRADEATDATYGDRVRRRLRPTERHDTNLLVRSLLALGPQVCGDAPRSDYLYLLLCLAFLRLYDQDHWVQLKRTVPSSGDPGDARRLLRRVVAAVDASLGYPELLKRSAAPPARLQPLAFEPVRKVMELAADLLPDDFRQVRAEFVREVCAGGDPFCTPASITRTMVALLADDTEQGNISVYDPFARFGELAAEFVRGSADPAAVRVDIEHPYPAALRLAGMELVSAGARAELALTSSPPPGGATFLLTNPPFGQYRELEWLRRCVASLALGGRAAVLMPYGAGFDPSARAREVRRELVEHGAVRAVVALPARMFTGTSIGVCAWLLRYPTGHAAPVQLVDARKLGRPSRTPSSPVHVFDATDTATIAETVLAAERRPGFSVLATPEEIQAHGYSLHPPEYQDRTSAPTAADTACAELAEVLEGPSSPSYITGRDSGWPRHRLGDICAIRTGVPHGSLKPSMARANTARETVPVVHPRHLRYGLIRADDAPDADVTTLEQYRLQTGDVLWIRTGAMGQTAIVRPSESGWLPHTNLLRLRVTNTASLDPGYLLVYLSQPAVQARIRDRSVRSVTTSLSTATLGDLEMPLPPLADQQRILSVLESLDEQAAALERRLNAARAARTAFGRHLTDGTVILTEGQDK